MNGCLPAPLSSLLGRGARIGSAPAANDMSCGAERRTQRAQRPLADSSEQGGERQTQCSQTSVNHSRPLCPSPCDPKSAGGPGARRECRFTTFRITKLWMEAMAYGPGSCTRQPGAAFADWQVRQSGPYRDAGVPEHGNPGRRAYGSMGKCACPPERRARFSRCDAYNCHFNCEFRIVFPIFACYHAQ